MLNIEIQSSGRWELIVKVGINCDGKVRRWELTQLKIPKEGK